MTQPAQVSEAEGLSALEARARRDLDILSYPSRPWVQSRQSSTGEDILDVLVIGGGQGGLGVASGLLREKVERVLVVDKNPENYEGPWRTFARMITLRTPKHVLGPDHGVPSLSIRSWYEAQHGEGSWETLGLIPKGTWADYLYWFRSFLQLPVENDTTAGALEWLENERCFKVPLTKSGQTRAVLARKVVLATGIEGSGDWQVPAFIRDSLPSHLYSHTRADIDFEALKGKDIAVLGAGASAFDNAATAIEHGAAGVDMFFRRKSLVRVNAYRWAEFVGFLKHHADLPDDERWRFIHKFVTMGQLPPADTYARAKQHAGFRLHPAAPWTKVEARDNRVKITTPHGEHEVDYVIVGTGFVTDLGMRPELEHFSQEIQLWQDAYTPPDDLRHPDLERHPYLGPSFELIAKAGSSADWLSNVYNYTFGCLVSLGLGGASISGMKYSLRRIVDGITRELYREQSEYTYGTLRDFDVVDFEP